MDPILRKKLIAEQHSKPRAKPLGADQRLLILQKLQGKLDLALLFEIFTREVEKQIDISRLVWECDNTTLPIRRGPATEHRKTFLLRFSQHELGKLQYITPYPLDNDEISLLHTYHRLFAGPLMNAIEYRRVKNMALQDYLSGLGNRSCFEQDVSQAIAMSERRNVGLVLVLFDLDNFKQVNDRFGHPDGDKVIRQFSQLLKKSVRASDRCYRIGGDEFAVLLQPATDESALQVYYRVEQMISDDPILRPLNIGCSCGYTSYRHGDSSTTLVDRADRQLYAHKRGK
ncbi:MULTISPECIES: GGDEF domain-containing protein [Photobacterium]|uniref:diguanylate cyclase n=1 Tax=Photobacterium ganghwense TaxID=320778 RepID=A0A0J1HJF4_9GAMM|nr:MULTISPECIES: GGDEF domain-containing protein [Photobacterium]KLV11701.1 diguanylate cyclase [Photobacterium ganghwense]MBV1840502.1 GGDEF domain-containing protein [Photobacterium ganghwense]PSU04560.1 GGDEF domain-containing protein [Photobacterium ganghwense]QSV14655.1 GGDEF domain-containing protein [Photobacterium ganghwense]